MLKKSQSEEIDNQRSAIPAILLVGLNHNTAPVELREQFSLPVCATKAAMEDLLATLYVSTSSGKNRQSNEPPIRECVILSTCNRFEIYAVADDHIRGRETIENFLAKLQGIKLDDIKPHLYFYEGQSVVVHLMKVGAGLDSMILGEPQIQGQVSNAFRDAKSVDATGPVLSHLFSQAAHAGKRARTETEISKHTASVSHAAANLAEQKLGSLEGLRALIVGAGEMGQLAAEAMLKRGLKEIACINRTYAAAADLARLFKGKALNWYNLPEALVWADVVISATGAPHTIIREADVRPVIKQRTGRDLLMIDIAVPRDIDVTVGDLPNVMLCDVDDLQITVDDNIAQRKACIPSVEKILGEEVEEFLEWMHGRRVVPVIVDMRQQANALANEELQNTIDRMNDLDEHDLQLLQRMTHRIVNKVLHEATVNLKSYSCRPNTERCAMRGYVKMLEQGGNTRKLPNPEMAACLDSEFSLQADDSKKLSVLQQQPPCVCPAAHGTSEE